MRSLFALVLLIVPFASYAELSRCEAEQGSVPTLMQQRRYNGTSCAALVCVYNRLNCSTPAPETNGGDIAYQAEVVCEAQGTRCPSPKDCTERKLSPPCSAAFRVSREGVSRFQVTESVYYPGPDLRSPSGVKKPVSGDE